MKNLFVSMVSAIFLITSLQVRADDLRLGQPGYGGTGCPGGTASVVLSPDQKAISFLFDAYQVQAGRPTGRTLDRKSCNISVPVHVPQGFSVAVFNVDYRGFNDLPRGGKARFDAEYFWAGSRGPHFSRDFTGPTQGNYIFSNGLTATSLVWTPCGASVILRANTSLLTQVNSLSLQSMSTVDSADVSGGLIYHLQWRRCN